MSIRPYLAFTISLCLALIGSSRSIAAQSLEGAVREARFETRVQLELAARHAVTEHRDSEALLLQLRLRLGDFQEGDRIVLSIEIPNASSPENPGALPVGGIDTAVVRAGKVLQFTKVPKIPDLSLDGVLRSELVDTVTAHLKKYVRNPRVRATPLLRVAVMGAIGRPGWYLAPSDAVLADVIMQAGGITAQSDVEKTLIRRAGKDIWSSADVRVALSEGFSLDRLDLQAGDEIYVSSKRQWSVTNSIQLLTGLAGAYVALRLVRQRR